MEKVLSLFIEKRETFFIIVPYFQINLTGDEFLQGIGVCLHLDQPDTEFRVKQFGCIVWSYYYYNNIRRLLPVKCTFKYMHAHLSET